MAGTNGHTAQAEQIRAAQVEEASALNPPVDPMMRTLQEASVLIQRMQFLRQAGITFNGARDTYEVLGYDRLISNRQYRDRYARGGIAGRVVDAPTDATWRGTMEVVEDLDRTNDTKFELAWKAFDQRLQVQAKLRRVDKLSQLSNFACLLIGAEGDLNTPLPKGNRQEQILFLSAFSGGSIPGIDAGVSRTTNLDGDMSVFELDTDPYSTRFGLAKTYQIQRVALTSAMGSNPGGGTAGFQSQVHWTRVLHVAEGCLFDELTGQPALERVWNLLDDLDKVTGGGSEAFWLRANQGLHINIDKDLQLPDTTAAVAALKEQAEEYKHQMTRWLRTRGVDVKTLGSDVANFSNPADAILTQIAGAKAIPKRILTGSEMGELASSQDRDNWKDQVNGRQTQYAGPYIVRPLVDRLIQYGYLPAPSKGALVYEVKWPHIQTLTEQEKAEGANKWASTNQTNGQPVFTSEEIRKKWYEMEKLTPEQLEEDRELKDIAKPAPEMVPGQQQQELPFGEPRTAEAEMLNVLEAAVECNNLEVVDAILGTKHLRTEEHRKFSSTQIQLPQDIADKICAFEVTEEDLHEEGREKDCHVTVKYGLHTNRLEDVKNVVEGWGEVMFTLGKTMMFRRDEYDVLIVEVLSPDLSRLNRLLSKTLEVTDTWPEYRPHVTIAYLQPGKGDKYVGKGDFEGKTITATELIFSSQDDEKTVIRL